MGFDLVGRKTGSKFRANVWSWRPIVDAIEETRVLTPGQITAISYNGGFAITDEEAQELAARLQARLSLNLVPVGVQPDQPAEGHLTIHEPNEEGSSGFCSDPNCTQRHYNVYSVEKDHLLQFISFARESGGFEVW